ncbi:DUF1236 domain-containing protein [Bosea thiooxidans]
MKRFAGIAAVVFAAHAGLAVAQPVMPAPDEGPRGRMERPPGGAEPRGPGGSDREAPQRQPDGPSRAQRGAQMEELRAQEQQRSQELRERAQEQQQRAQEQRMQGQQREQTQRAQEQRRGQEQQRAQEQRMQSPQGEQNQAQREQQGQRAPAQQNAQPQQPDERTNRRSTMQPSQPGQDDRQRATSPTPAPGPGAPQTGTAGRAPAATGPQSAQGQAGNAETQRIADTVRQRVERKEIRPVSDFGVSASVGTELPSRLQLQPLPREIAAIRPQYRDYRFTVSEREIVIVDPRSRRIVEVIARDGRGGPDIYASFEQRRDVRRWRRPDTVVFRQGVILPPDAYYYDLPVEVVEQHPDWRGYQYVMTESEEVAIVEPRSRRIVEVVDKGATRSAAAGPVTTGSTAPAATDDRHEIARIILGDSRPGDMQGIDGLKGAVLPNEIVLRPLPREAEDRDSSLRGYQYTLIGDDVLIVDPQSRRIIDVIE